RGLPASIIADAIAVRCAHAPRPQPKMPPIPSSIDSAESTVEPQRLACEETPAKQSTIMNRRDAVRLGLLGSAALGASVPALAQDNFPSRSIRLVVSFPPGGGVDAVARLFADKMSPMLAQPVVVENRGGASGTIAGKQVAAANPDGYTVLVASNSMLVAQVMNPRTGLDIERELLGIA